MAQYNNNRYYWLQLKEDFFEEDAISWLEDQPNGKEYALFYLKLCLKSLKTNGILIRQVGEVLMPYDVKKLSEITKTDIDTVVVAMEILKQIGLIKILENGEIYIAQLSQMIGSQTIGAYKKQIQLKKKEEVKQIGNIQGELELDDDGKLGVNYTLNNKGGTKVENLPPDIDIEIDIDKEIEKEKEKEKESGTPLLTYLSFDPKDTTPFEMILKELESRKMSEDEKIKFLKTINQSDIKDSNFNTYLHLMRRVKEYAANDI